MPLLARYTFTRPAARLQVAALGGASWLHGGEPMGYHYNALSQHFELNKASNQLGLVLGPQLSYVLGPAVALDLSAALMWAVTGNRVRPAGDRLLLSPQLGVHYALIR